jgi:bacterioferritin-associated ferredoxin
MAAMIVCVCNAITEDELRELAKSGARTPEDAYAVLGQEPQCGSCLCYAQELMDETRTALPVPKLRIVA